MADVVDVVGEEELLQGRIDEVDCVQVAGQILEIREYAVRADF